MRIPDINEQRTPLCCVTAGEQLGALHLYAMDAWFAAQMEQAKKNNKPGIDYARHMDDVVTLAHTRWQLRKQVRALNQFFTEAGFCQHPDKTFIGRTARGYDWMGAQMSDVGVEGIAHRARANHPERMRRLYEQVRRWPAARRQVRMSQYRKRWKIWAGALTCIIMGSGNALAVVGTAADITAGLNACLANRSLKPLGGGMWGGRCVIDLKSAQFWVGSNTIPTTHTETQSYQYATLVWANKPAGMDMSFVSGVEIITRYNKTVIARWPSGTVFRVGNTVGARNESIHTKLPRGGNFTYVNPGDRSADVGGWDTYGGNLGTLTWDINVPLGSSFSYPTLNLHFGSLPTSNAGYTQMSLGIGGNNNVNPTPPTPPVAGEPPNCTAINGASIANINFGNGIATASPGKMTTSATAVGHRLSLTCSGGTYGSNPAKATLYVSSAMAKTTDNLTLLASAGDWLGLRLKLPTTRPTGNGYVASGQTLGNYVVWNGANSTPIWTWDMAEVSTQNGDVPTTIFTLSPEIYQLGYPGPQSGTRNYIITYSAVIQ